MSQKLRTRLPGVTYHAASRCIDKKPLMKSAFMKDLMLKVLNLALTKYSFELCAYAIMDNHFHFLIRTIHGGADISHIMQFIKAQYARRYNRIMKRTGPFWNERFSDKIIESADNPIEAFNNTLLYMAYNPVRSGYVQDPRDYKFSSFNSYLNENYNSPVGITIHHIFFNFGNSFKECVNILLDLECLYRKQSL